MKVEQLYTKCLAQGAYYIQSGNEAAIIDPLRETEPYIALAKENGATIKYIFETHFHADFVSGHIDLAKKTGAQIIFGPNANPSFDHVTAKDGQVFKIGEISVQAIHTPGHTLESTCYLLKDKDGKNEAIFSGDTLFLGDVGRPDLAIKSDLTQEDLAAMLFHSLRDKIMVLEDELTIYPGHGAGSSCGKSLSSETVGTLGEQKKTNYALRADMTEAEFVKEVTDGILPPPSYFAKNAHLNKHGYDDFESVLEKGLSKLSFNEFNKKSSEALILDVRNEEDYKKLSVPNSLFIGLNGTFAMWVGALIEDINQEIILICPEGKEEEAIMRLARVGYDNCVGYLDGTVDAYLKSQNITGQEIKGISAEKLSEIYNESNIVDVRKPGEFDSAHLPKAQHLSLDLIYGKMDQLDKNTEYTIHCGGGYRSVIAISILLNAGFKKLIDVEGGFAAIKKTDLPLEESSCANK